MKNFIKRHKYHLLIFASLIIIACVSGIYLKISDLPTPPAPPLIGGNKSTSTSQTNNKNQLPVTSYQLPVTKDGSTSTEQQNNTATEQQINHLIIQSSDYSEIITATSTVYDMMSKLQSQDKFTFKTKEFAGLGQFVEEINGVKNDPQANKYWIYYINGKSAQVGISNYILKLNDLIEWKYETTNL